MQEQILASTSLEGKTINPDFGMTEVAFFLFDYSDIHSYSQEGGTREYSGWKTSLDKEFGALVDWLKTQSTDPYTSGMDATTLTTFGKTFCCFCHCGKSDQQQSEIIESIERIRDRLVGLIMEKSPAEWQTVQAYSNCVMNEVNLTKDTAFLAFSMNMQTLFKVFTFQVTEPSLSLLAFAVMLVCMVRMAFSKGLDLTRLVFFPLTDQEKDLAIKSSTDKTFGIWQVDCDKAVSEYVKSSVRIPLSKSPIELLRIFVKILCSTYHSVDEEFRKRLNYGSDKAVLAAWERMHHSVTKTPRDEWKNAATSWQAFMGKFRSQTAASGVEMFHAFEKELKKRASQTWTDEHALLADFGIGIFLMHCLYCMYVVRDDFKRKMMALMYFSLDRVELPTMVVESCLLGKTFDELTKEVNTCIDKAVDPRAFEWKKETWIGIFKGLLKLTFIPFATWNARVEALRKCFNKIDSGLFKADAFGESVEKIEEYKSDIDKILDSKTWDEAFTKIVLDLNSLNTKFVQATEKVEIIALCMHQTKLALAVIDHYASFEVADGQACQK